MYLIQCHIKFTIQYVELSAYKDELCWQYFYTLWHAHDDDDSLIAPPDYWLIMKYIVYFGYINWHPWPLSPKTNHASFHILFFYSDFCKKYWIILWWITSGNIRGITNIWTNVNSKTSKDFIQESLN